jgi:hypothetical protein
VDQRAGQWCAVVYQRQRNRPVTILSRQSMMAALIVSSHSESWSEDWV